MADTQWPVARITGDDMDDIVLLHDIYLNYGDGVRPHFEKALADPGCVGYKCTLDGRMVGLVIYTPGVALSGGHGELYDKILAVTGEALTYTGDALLVDRDYRRQGIDASMMEAARDTMAGMGVKYVVHELWVHPTGKIPARRAIDCYPVNIDLGLYANFYRDFNRYGYICPICGVQCVCSAQLYVSCMEGR